MKSFLYTRLFKGKRSAGLFSSYQNQLGNQDFLNSLYKRSAGLFQNYKSQLNNNDFLNGLYRVFKNVVPHPETRHVLGGLSSSDALCTSEPLTRNVVPVCSPTTNHSWVTAIS